MDGAAGPSEVTQINDYFPFGLQFPKACGAVVVPENRYKFNGIEHIAELELDMAAFRSYDAAIGRWMQVDPLAEKYYAMSPYNGMGNNPILYSDPMGDTIRVSEALANNIATNGAFKEFISSEEGKAFEKLFGEGGEFGEILVTFDVSYNAELGTGGVTTPLARDKKGKTERLYAKEDIDRGLAPEGARSSLKNGESLAFLIEMSPLTMAMSEDRRNTVNRALQTLHEAQHVEITTKDIYKDGVMNYGAYNQHLMMKDARYGNYLQQRINFFSKRRPDFPKEDIKRAVNGFQMQ